jgi:hypothetical protein
MSHTSPNYADWRSLSAIKVWEVAALMHGVDPRTLGDVLVADPNDPTGKAGMPLDTSWEERMLISAVKIQDILSAPLNVYAPDVRTEVNRVSLIPWLRIQSYPDLADELADGPVTASADDLSGNQELADPEPRPAATGSRLRTTKAAMIAQHKHEWPTVAQDIKDAQRNGLSGAAKAGAREWHEPEAMAWALAKNRRQKSPITELTTVASTMPTLETLPSRQIKGC